METERSPLISVVVPLYKEAGNLRSLLSNVTSELAKTGYRYELIVIDDGSPDETWQIISEQAQANPHLRGFRRCGFSFCW